MIYTIRYCWWILDSLRSTRYKNEVYRVFPLTQMRLASGVAYSNITYSSDTIKRASYTNRYRNYYKAIYSSSNIRAY